MAFDENENEREKGERKRWVLSFLRGGRGGGVTEVDLQSSALSSPSSGVARGGGHMARLIVCWWEARSPHRLIIGIVRRPGGRSLPLP